MVYERERSKKRESELASFSTGLRILSSLHLRFKARVQMSALQISPKLCVPNLSSSDPVNEQDAKEQLRVTRDRCERSRSEAPILPSHTRPERCPFGQLQAAVAKCQGRGQPKPRQGQLADPGDVSSGKSTEREHPSGGVADRAILEWRICGDPAAGGGATRPPTS
jgi:hypothetical protein